MTTRSRGMQQNQWDDHDDFNTSLYDAQYPDEDVNGGVELDHCRLYITNISKVLSEDGLRTAFEKFGSLVEVHLNRDPQKRYALVRYQTPGEARLAMTKLNRTEPLKLNVSIAHKPKPLVRQHLGRRDRASGSNREERASYRDERSSNRGDSASISSRGKHSRKQEEPVNGGEVDDEPEDEDFGYTELDPNLHLELETLKLQQLKLQEEQLMCKHRMLLLRQADKKPVLNQVSNRCILPDGKIVVRNVSERAPEPEVSFSAGGGDSQKIPGLQSIGSRACVSCGRPADSFCSGCGLTPYCGPRCQRRDWADRHRAVCHNLARLGGSKESGGGKESGSGREPGAGDATPITTPIVPAAALRAPHSIQSSAPRRDPKRQEDDQKSNKKPSPRLPAAGRGCKPNDSPNLRRPASDRFKPNSKQDGPGEEPAWTPDPGTPPAHQRAAPSVPKPVEQRAKPEPPPLQEPRPPLASVNDVTPARLLVPKSYLIEQLDIGDTLLLSVDGKASECRSVRDGFVCLSMHERYELDYSRLCEDFVLACEADSAEYKPAPGGLCAYLNPEDGAWYRGRSLAPDAVALLDCGKVVSLRATDGLRALPAAYQDIPEFCCLLQASSIKVGNNLKCSILSKTAEAHRVSIEDVETGLSMGQGELFRWTPTVEYAAPKPVIPEVARPALRQGGHVFLVDAASPGRAFVCPAGEARAAYEALLQQAAIAGLNAEPLAQPPAKGQTVLGKFSDGVHYRALCKRTNAKQDKYLLEYIEFGNVEVSKLENIYPCPKSLELEASPTLVSQVSLSNTATEFTPAALEYIDKLKEDCRELLLSIPGGAQTAASGSLVDLTVLGGENVNKRIDELCKPQWKRIEETMGDVIAVQRLMFSELENMSLPSGGCALEVLDASALATGVLSVCPQGDPHAAYVFSTLADKMAAYCNSDLGREPYLPRPEELCIARQAPNAPWLRAVMLQQEGGPGGSSAQLCFVDVGGVASVDVSLLRKMLPEFVTGLPMVATQLDIKGFPEQPTAEMVQRALSFLRVGPGGRGSLLAKALRPTEPGVYEVDAPDLLAAMGLS